MTQIFKIRTLNSIIMNKKFLVLGVFCAMAAMSVSAQQLPNVGFEKWENAGKTTDLAMHPESLNFNRPGMEPEGWNGSSVDQLYIEELTRKSNDAKTGALSVSIYNKFLGIPGIMGSVAPGYFTLGTPWVAADLANVPNSNGGTFGGVEFTSYPDAIVGQFKRIDTTVEKSTIIAYLWNGEFDSNIGKVDAMNHPVKNADRAILGKEGAGTVSGAGTLVASLEKTFTKDEAKDWTEFVVPFNYVNNKVAPTMMNVIVAAGDYWNRASLLEKTELLVDDLRFVYYSTLESLKVNGVAVPNFKSDVYSYDLVGELPTPEQVEYVAKGISCNELVTVDQEASVVKITLTGEGEDLDGQTSHTYVLNYKKAEAHAGAKYDGSITINLMGTITPVPNQSVYIEKAADGKSCTFSLYKFSLDGDPANSLGDIIVENVTIEDKADSYVYAGAKNGIQLGGGMIQADAKLDGTETKADNHLVMNIHVEWINGKDRIPIEVVFDGKAVQGGVENIEAANAVVVAENGVIAINGFKGNAEVYALDGSLVASAKVNGEAQINVAKGMYIVRLADKGFKVIVK